MILLSLIVPAYNVEKYIEKCLESTQRQNVAESLYEVIVIIDGSKDSSERIAREVASRYSNIQVVYQENEGLSGARNNGLKLAKGKYVWFVDSDDWIEKECLAGIIYSLRNQTDILQLQRRLAYDDSSLNRDMPVIHIPPMSGKDVLKRYRVPAPAQFCIYRREFLLDNNLVFVKGILHEDSEFKPRALYLATKVASHDTIVYNYYQRTSGNIMSSFKMKNVRDLMIVNNNLYRFSKKIERDVQPTFNYLIGLNTNTIVDGFVKLSKEDQIETLEILGRNKHLFMRMLQSKELKYRMEGLVLLIDVRLGIKLYKMIR